MGDEQEKLVSEPNKQERIAEIIKQLSPLQLRFIAAMLESKSKKEAAEKIGIEVPTAYCWPEKDLVDEAIRLIILDQAETARQIRKKNLVKAMMVKVKGLDSQDERISQGASTEIIEAELGKATQPIGLSEKIVVTLKTGDD